jgi:hypothetical protein
MVITLQPAPFPRQYTIPFHHQQSRQVRRNPLSRRQESLTADLDVGLKELGLQENDAKARRQRRGSGAK